MFLAATMVPPSGSRLSRSGTLMTSTLRGRVTIDCNFRYSVLFESDGRFCRPFGAYKFNSGHFPEVPARSGPSPLAIVGRHFGARAVTPGYCRKAPFGRETSHSVNRVRSTEPKWKDDV